MADKERAMTGKKELNQVVIGALKVCTARPQIDDTFEKYSIVEQSLRVNYLNTAMGNPKTFFSSENLPVEMQYEVTIRMFLAGTWKLATLYEKAGL
jgi:hypothetical protein